MKHGDYTTLVLMTDTHQQYTAARLVCHAMKADHITPVLKDLHWLRIQERIIITITYNGLTLCFLVTVSFPATTLTFSHSSFLPAIR